MTLPPGSERAEALQYSTVNPHESDPALHSLLERQQINVHQPGGETFWHWVRFDLLARVVAQRGSAEVLDLGAGAGGLGDWTRRERPQLRYRFEELSPRLDALLAERFGNAARFPTDSAIESTTVVAMLDVLEHIEDDTAFLAHLAQRMQPGATLVVTVPALQWAFTSWDTELGHYRRYSRRQLRSALTTAGLDVQRSQYIFPELLPLLVVRKFKRAKRADVDFPQLPAWLNRLGYWLSSCSARLRMIWPLGTSVIAVAEKAHDNG